jgi:MFS family permease
MIVLQSLMGLQALVFGILTITHTISLWQIAVLAVALGLNNTFENPARQTFVFEMVGPEHVRNAVTLNTVLVNVARAVGPAVAGIIIAAGGYGICFLINAASFVAVVTSLMRMDLSKITPAPANNRAKGQLLEGFRYVRGEVGLAIPLVMMAIVGCLAYEFQVTLPVMATRAFHGGSKSYGFMTAAMGVGAVLGGLYFAGRGKTGLKSLTTTAMIFAGLLGIAAIVPNLTLELILLAAVGAASVSFLSKGNSTLQLAAAPNMRGRVMALWSVAFLGSTPIGGPIAGAVSQYVGPRWGLGLGALACAVAAVLGLVVMRRVTQASATEPITERVGEAEGESELEVAEAAR